MPAALSAAEIPRYCEFISTDLDFGLFDAVQAAHFLNLGAKGEGRRNLELGLLSRDDLLLDEVQAFFDAIGRGQPCSGCKLRDECAQPLG
jgi:hypothetical protein